MSRRPKMAPYKRDVFEQAQRALDVSTKLYERHESGPVGRYHAHVAMHEVGIFRCPICESPKAEAQQ